MAKYREDKAADILRSAEDMPLHCIREEEDEYSDSKMDQSHNKDTDAFELDDEFKDFEQINPKISFRQEETKRIGKLENDMKRIEDSINKHKR